MIFYAVAILGQTAAKCNLRLVDDVSLRRKSTQSILQECSIFTWCPLSVLSVVDDQKKSTDANRPVCRIALFLLSTGCRLNEALSAKWNQIDKENRVWRIPATNSKSKRVRSVPLNDSALGVLSELDTEGTFDYLFVNTKTREPYGRIHKAWHRIRKVAGVPFLRIHDLRHGFASFLVNSGRTLFEVQQILGHSDPKVTQRYSHLSSKSLQDAANSASRIIAAASVVPLVDSPVTQLPTLEAAE